MSPVDDVSGFGGQENFLVLVGVRTPDRPARRVEKLLHNGHVQHTFLSPSVQKNLVSNSMTSRQSVTSF